MITIHEKIKIMQHVADGGEVEVRVRGDRYWNDINTPLWDWDNFDYRIKAFPDTIDWSHVHPDFKWMARYDNGKVFLYTEEPKIMSSYWSTNGLYRNAGAFVSFKNGTVDWKDSLVERPKSDES